MEVAQQLLDRHLKSGARSEAYKKGMLTSLEVRLEEKPTVLSESNFDGYDEYLDGVVVGRCPFPFGTSDADAYLAGAKAGRLLAGQSGLE